MKTHDESNMIPPEWPSSRQESAVRPLFREAVSAGFPLPVEGGVERGLNLHKLCVKNPPSTFFVRVEGNSMIGAGIHEGDILVVDRSLKAGHGDVIIIALEGQLTVKRLSLIPYPRLLPENDAYSPIDFPEDSHHQVFGVVTTVVHSLRGTLC